MSDNPGEPLVVIDSVKKEFNPDTPGPNLPVSVDQPETEDSIAAPEDLLINEKTVLGSITSSLSDLNLFVTQFESWIILQRSTFDLYLFDQPYHAIQLFIDISNAGQI